MTVATQRSLKIVYTGDMGGTQEFSAAQNSPSPGSVELVSLTEGDDLIEVLVPSGATAMTIVKPSDNTRVLTLASVADETGLALHPTDPDTISLSPSQTSVWLAVVDDGDEATETVTIQVRIFWT